MKPIIYFDLETTGKDVKTARIVEVCMLKVFPGGKEELKSTRINPTIPIPAGATEIHGITDEMVQGKPTFKQLSASMLAFLDGADLCGYNILAYDVPLLYCEFYRAGLTWDYQGTLFLDACTIYKRKEARGLTDAVRFYLNEQHEEAHSAEPDVRASMRVFQAQREKYGDLPTDLTELARFSNYDRDVYDLLGCFGKDDSGDWIFTFGKHKDKKAKDNLDYLSWMTGQDFLPDALGIVRSVLEEGKLGQLK